MKISKTEGGSSKYRGLGLGALAAIVAIGSASFYYQFSNTELTAASSQGDMAIVKPTVHDVSTCGHDHSRDKSEVKVISQVVISDDLDLVNSKVGEVMELAFGDELKVSGKVTMNKEVVGGRKAIGMTLDAQGSYLYWLEDLQGGVIGNIVIKKDEGNQVYKFKHQEGIWSFEKISFKNYLCASGNKDKDAGYVRALGAPVPMKIAQVAVAVTPPVLNSFPGAQSVLYLDFDGETVVGTRWNAGFGDIVAAPSNYTEEGMRDVWHQVSADMRPFKLNVTTDRSVFDAAPVNKRMQVIFTPTQDFYPTPGVLGVAYLESFYDGAIDPCWAFESIPSESGIVASHETGHTFGLNHDGFADLEYYGGNGTWGPVMGNPFDQITSWSKGDYDNASNTFEDDLAIIDANSAPYRVDDYGNSDAEAFVFVDADGNGGVDLVGNVEKNDDVDVFTFLTAGGSTQLNILTNPDLPNPKYSNINIQATLYDENGLEIAQSSDPGYGASINETLTAGAYFLHVEGIADGDVNVDGFTNYGSLGEYKIEGTVEGMGGVIVEIIEPKIADVSLKLGNGLVLNASLRGAADSVLWSQVSGPGVAEFESVDTLSSRVTFPAPGLYVLMFKADKAGLDSSEASLNVSVENVGDAPMFANQGPSIMLTTPEEFYALKGLLTAQVDDDGVPSAASPVTFWVKISGEAILSRTTSLPAIIIFKDNQPNEIVLEASDGQIRTFQRVSVVSLYETIEVIEEGASARWFVPMDDTLGSMWAETGFDDSSWSLSELGIGYNTKHDYVALIGAGSDLMAVMRGQSPSAFVRIPFVLPAEGYVQGLDLKMSYNDGFAIYLNGAEVLRRNVPTGDLHWDSVAARSRSFADVRIPDSIDLFSIGGGGEVNSGENVLAIHGLNRSASDKEFLLSPVLSVGVVNAPYFGFSEKYGGSLDPNGDDDGDGIPNFIEHGRGTDPTVANTLEHLVPLPDGSMEITLPVDAPQDMVYEVEHSSDLSAWKMTAIKNGMADWRSNEMLISVSSMDAEHVTYKLTLPDGAPKAFFRLVYTLRGSQSTTAP